ncbi:MAG TPA: hypothetical protein VER12_18310 [Polyangiaceae bacterium]|nr:hypothetical protein [Polyangiaceae bacterium]
MKATFGNSFAKRSLVIAATALPSLYSGLASAQAAPPPPPPAPAAAPVVPAAAAPAAPPAPVAGSPAPPAVADAPAVVTPAVPAPPAAAAVPADAPPPEAPPAPVDPDAETYKHINMGVWMRTGFAMQNASNPKKLDGIGMGGEAELHFSNTMRKGMSWTANFAASYGAPDGGSFVAPNPPGGSITGTLAVMDLIAQYEPDPAFNIWVGRMLVASDRSNFSGPYFMAPWIYPLFLGPQGNPYAVVGPKEGPYGRNDGATVWGQAGGGMFKYYLGAYNMFDAAQKPLISGRLALSLLSPEPGYYGSSTYLGKDILALGLGGQYQKNGDTYAPASDGRADYGMVLADALFEKDFKAAGVLDIEGAFYKYVGDGQSMNFSYMGLASYLISKFQPLVRVQQAKMKDVADGGNGNTVTMIDGQVAYYVDGYSTKMVLGVSHSSDGADAQANSVFAGIQLQK